MSVQALALRILELRKPETKLRRSLFAQQMAMLQDDSPFKAACCTRRAGKSHLAAAALLLAGLSRENVDVLYLGLTIGSSKRIMLPKFREINRLLGGSFLQINESDSLVKLPNGSRIWIIGADHKHLMDTLLGNKWARAMIDEAQSFGKHITELIDDVLGPALLDLQGDLWLLGTPGPIPAGFFYDAIHSINSGYKKFKWSLFDNPHLPHAREWLEALKKRKGWNDDTPTYARQYLNKWVYDPDSLVYSFSSSRDFVSELPSGLQWNYVLGLDYGWHDKTAFCIMCYSERHPIAYVLKVWGRSGMIVSEIATEVKLLSDKYNFEAIVCDTGGLGKSITEEFRQRYGLPVRAAEKTDKMAFIASFNGELKQGTLKLVESGTTELVEQYQALQYDDRKKEDPDLPNDLCDATLYPTRYILHYLYREPVKLPQIGSEEWALAQENAMIDSFTQQHARREQWI